MRNLVACRVWMVLGVVVSLGAAVALPGCSKKNEVTVSQSCSGPLVNEGEECDAKEDCPCGGQGACVLGICRKKCATDAACPAGAICAMESSGNGGCLLLSEQGCSPTQPCPSPRLTCGGDNKCRLPCNAANPCPNADQLCLFGACYGKNEKNAVWACGGDDPNQPTFRCKDAVLETCNAKGLGWAPLATCASPALCEAGKSSGACAPLLCNAGAYQCNGARLERCNSDWDAWDVLGTCASYEFCVQQVNKAGSKEPTCPEPTCKTGERSCDGSKLRVCKSDLTGWSTLATCASEALCDQGVATGACGQPPCAEDDYRCRGSQLEQCKADLTGWDLADTCDSDALCNQALASEDTTDLVCPAAACAAGDFGCDGSALRVCNDDLTGWTVVQSCASDVLCTQGLANHLCGNATCLAGTFVCAGNALERCKDNSTGYELIDTCGSSDLCNKTLTDGLDEETIQCDQACTPGEYSCDGKRLLRCKQDGSATELMESCASAALCQEAASEESDECPAACAAGECQGDELWTCRSDLTDVELKETCSSATMCLPGAHAKCMEGGLAMIDNLEDGDIDILNHDGRSGGWWTGTDQTSVLTFGPVEAAAGPTADNLYALGVSGSNFTTYAVCGVAIAGVGVYDASKYAGITFWAKRSPATAKEVRVTLSDAPNITADEEGGLCELPVNDCLTGRPEVQFDLATNWKQFAFTWTQAGTYGVDASGIHSIELQFRSQDFDIQLDDLAFLQGFEAADAGCEADTYECRQASLVKCRGDGSGWDYVDNCGFPQICANGIALGACPATCTPGQGLCRARERWLCNAEGTAYEKSEVCDMSVLCRGGAHPACLTGGDELIDNFEDGDLQMAAVARRTGDWWGGPEVSVANQEISGRDPESYRALACTVTADSGFPVCGVHLASYSTGAWIPFDASAYAGVTFWAKANAAFTARLGLTDEYTDPRGDICDPDPTATAMQCYQSFGQDLDLTTDWQQVTLSWDDLDRQSTPGGDMPDALVVDAIYELHLQLPLNTDSTQNVVYIDDISFTTE